MHKKIFSLFSILFISTSYIGIRQAKVEKDPKSKIVFENCDNKIFSLESQEMEKDSLNTQYSLKVKLDYEMPKECSFKNKDEKNKEYQRLKDYFTSQNQKLTQKMSVLNNFEDVYISKYAPYIEINTTYENLQNSSFKNLTDLAKVSYVETIYVNQTIENNSYMFQSEINTCSYDYIQNRTYDGTGVTVGLLEPGIPQKNHQNFTNVDIEVRDLWYKSETITDHTTQMASVIAGVDGIAPKVSLKCAQLFGSETDEIDWFLDKQCDIVNCSYGNITKDGVYSSQSAYIDYIAYTYHLNFIIAAGNIEDDGNTYVANPGLAYNAITVGAIDGFRGTVTDFSSYEEVKGPRKPDLLAPGNLVNIWPWGSTSGTSVSCAFTTGIASLLMQAVPMLHYNTHLLQPVLCAYTEDQKTRSIVRGYNDKAGAGVLNFENLVSLKVASNHFTSDNNLTQLSERINAQSNDLIKVCLFWYAKATGKAEETAYTEYQFSLYDPDGYLVQKQALSKDNKQLLEYKAFMSGQYEIRITRLSNLPDGLKQEKLGLGYMIQPENSFPDREMYIL